MSLWLSAQECWCCNELAETDGGMFVTAETGTNSGATGRIADSECMGGVYVSGISECSLRYQ